MLTTKKFSVDINASPNKVWFSLWETANYTKWTSIFCEGSYMKTDWKVGSRTHFLSPDGGGLYSILIANIENEKMFFTHLGELKNFEEEPIDDNTKSWTGSRENYSLTREGDRTTLTVEMDIAEAYMGYFAETFPKGLEKVKEIAENVLLEVTAHVNAPVEIVWKKWTSPEDIVNWNNASEDWHTTHAENDLRTGGKFSSRMESKDGVHGFDFGGIYDEVEDNKYIAYTMGDGRIVKISFKNDRNATKITEVFAPEEMHPLHFQAMGWQAILDNFKKYVEQNT